MPKYKKAGQLVIPGERLGVIEELSPGKGAYVSNGVLYSSATGLLSISNKIASVYGVSYIPTVPYRGSIVVGQVVNGSSNAAFIEIFRIGRKFFPSPAFTGILHISMVSQGFVRSMLDVCREGDVVRARVVSVKNLMYHLSIKDSRFGVIYAFCSKCGELLVLRVNNLICPTCRNEEIRKIAFDYGKAVV